MSGPLQHPGHNGEVVVLHDRGAVQPAQGSAGLGERVAVAAVVHVVRDAGDQESQELGWREGMGRGKERRKVRFERGSRTNVQVTRIVMWEMWVKG